VPGLCGKRGIDGCRRWCDIKRRRDLAGLQEIFQKNNPTNERNGK